MPPAANRSRKRQRSQLATEPQSEATALATTSPNLPTNTDANDEVILESPQYTNMQSHTNDHNNERNFIFQQNLLSSFLPPNPSFFPSKNLNSFHKVLISIKRANKRQTELN